MIPREKQFNIRLTDEEMDQLRALAAAHDRSMNSFIRSLIRQAVNKSTIEVPAKKAKKQEAEYV